MRQDTKLVTPALLFHMKAQRPSTDEGAEDEMVAGIAWIKGNSHRNSIKHKTLNRPKHANKFGS